MRLMKGNEVRVKTEVLESELHQVGSIRQQFVQSNIPISVCSKETSSVEDTTNEEKVLLNMEEEKDSQRTHYNLRGTRNKSYANLGANKDTSSEEENVSSMSVRDSSSTSSSETEEESSSSEDEEEEVIRNQIQLSSSQPPRKRGRPREVIKRKFGNLDYFHCSTDGCKRVFFKQSLLEEHNQLHKPGSYSCSFCEVTEDTVLKLSMHELEKHPNITTTSPAIRGMYPCPRCPFQNRHAAEYHKHFAGVHVGGFGFKFSKIIKGTMQRYRCVVDECEKQEITFKRRELFEEHKKLHERGSYPCKICNKVFVNVMKLSLHESQTHSGNTADYDAKGPDKSNWRCARCPYESKLKSSYVKHFASVHIGCFDPSVGKELVACDICNRKLNKRDTYGHFKSHHDITDVDPGRIHKCDQDGCLACFLHPMQLYLHKRAQHSTMDPTRLSESDDSDYHPREIKNEEGKALFQCNLCSRKCFSLRNLQNHKRMYHRRHEVKAENTLHTHRMPLLCPVVRCSKTFHTKIGLENHKKLHGTFSCKFCNVVKEYAPDLANHEAEEHAASTENINLKKRAIKKFMCSRCPLGFHFGVKYHEHFMMEHLGLSIMCLTCPICKYQTSKESLKMHHSSSHDTEGMDSSEISNCNKCPAYFRLISQLIRHKNRVHKMHDCSECGRSFDSTEKLRKHMNYTHPYHDENPKDPFSCEMSGCKKRYTTQTLLDHHKRFYHNRAFVETKCQSCDKIFDSASGLRLHNRNVHTTTHSNDNVQNQHQLQNPSNQKRKRLGAVHRCEFDKCKGKFTTKRSLEDHHILRHELGRYPCNFCDLIVDTIAQLCTHEANKHSKNPDVPTDGVFNCSRCSYHARYSESILHHFAAVHLGVVESRSGNDKLRLYGIFKCGICDVEKNHARELALHEAQHNTNNGVNLVSGNKATSIIISCPRCTKTYTTEKMYIIHFLNIHLDRPSKRQICPNCGVDVVDYQHHYRGFHKTDGLDPSQITHCPECPAYFIKSTQLIRHKRMMHSSNLKCEECDKTFKSRSSLRAHMLYFHPNHDENPNLPLGCDTPGCKKRFALQAEVDWHKKWCADPSSGSNKKEHKCSECDKIFPIKNRLQTHMITVHAEPSFICSECGKGFRTKFCLENHLNYHKGPDSWKFQCSTCGKKCISKYALQAHMRTHTNEKPYVCQYCGQKYANQRNWKHHMLTKHQDEDDLPEIRKVSNENRVTRKGFKKGAFIIAGASPSSK